MFKTLFRQSWILVVFATLLLSVNATASKQSMHVLQSCAKANNQDIYNINSLCIDGEQIQRKNLLDTYGGHNVAYQTKSGNFSNISSYINGSLTSWEITSKEGLTYTYLPKETDLGETVYKVAKIKDSFSSTINLSYDSSEVSFIYEKVTDKNESLLSQVSIINESGTAQNYTVTYADVISTATIDEVSDLPTLSEQATYTYTYDHMGKLLRKNVTGTNIEARVTKYEYGKEDTNYIVKTINALEQIETKTYDEDNNLIALKDANKLTTLWEYDSNNQKTKEIRPDATITTYEYINTDLIENASSKVIVTTTGQPTLTKYYDIYNRKIRTEKAGFSNRLILEDITYDDNGRISSYTMPYFKGEKVYSVDIAYDAQNRVTSLDKPGLNETRLITAYIYDEDTTTITYPDGKTQVVNNDGSITDVTSEFDVLGNVIKTTDEKGQEVVLSYDELNRVVKKEATLNGDTQNVQTTYLVYDRANMGEGKLAYVKSKEYKKEYYYDELSRLKANKVFIGDKIFATQYSYTAEGKLDKTVSPDGFISINEYNDLGFLTAIKSPKSTSVELDFDNIKGLITENLTDEYSIYTQYYDLRAKVNYYTLKKTVYENLANQYTSIDTAIQAQLNSVSVLLGETIVLLQANVNEYENILANYKKIRESHLLPKLTQSNVEENFQWLSEIFDDKSSAYATLATTSIDKASSLLEGIITTPEILNDAVNIDRNLITYYKNQSDEIVNFASSYAALSDSYDVRYRDLQAGNGAMQDSAYLGMFDNNEFKYFYKIIDMDALGRVTNEIFGNGLVTKKEFDASSGALKRIVTGYYGNNDIKDIQYTYDTNNNLTTQYDVKQDYTQNYKYDSSNKLVSASSVGSSFYSNITYTYADPQFGGVKYLYEQSYNRFSENSGDITIGLNNPTQIKKDSLLKVQTLYSQDSSSYKKTITTDFDNKVVYKIDNNFKYEVNDTEVKYKNLIYANGKLVAVHNEEDIGELIIPNNYYMHSDVFNSIDVVTNEAAVVQNSTSYRPFGEPSDISWRYAFKETNSITSIGYKGYETDFEFKLIDVNGYLYDPTVAKTLSSKSITTLDDKSRDFFIYSSPTKYVDAKLDNWFENVSNNFNIQGLLYNNSESLYNQEVIKRVDSLSSFSNVQISSESPTDTSKIWYKPNATGGLDIYIYDGTSWVQAGATGSIQAAGNVTVQSEAQLNIMPCFYQDSAQVDLQNGNKIPYTCSTSQAWELGGEFVGTYSIVGLSTTYFNSLTGSKITAQANNAEFEGLKEFTKSDNYWLDTSGNYMISDSLANILTKTDMPPNSNAFFSRDTASYYALKKLDIPTVGEKWSYVASSLNDGSLNYENIQTEEGGYVYVPSVGKFFTHVVSSESDFWTDNATGDGQENASFIFTKGDRDKLPNVTHDLKVLTQELGTQPRHTLNGIVSEIDNNFYEWFYDVNSASGASSYEIQTVGVEAFSTAGVYYASIALDSSNAPYVFYEDHNLNSKATAKKFDGTSWITIGTEGFTPGRATKNSIAVDSSDTPYVVYRDEHNSNDIRVQKYNNGTTSWENVGESLSTSTDFSIITIDSSDNIYVAYVDSPVSSKISVKKFNGVSWDQVGLRGFSSSSVSSISLMADDNDVLYVAYKDDNNGGKMTVKKFIDSSWQTVGVEGFTTTNISYSSIAFDTNNTPYVSYINSDGKASVQKYNTSISTWETLGLDGFSSGTVTHASITIDNMNTPYVVYRDNGNASYATLKKFNGDSWETVTVDGFSSGSVNQTKIVIGTNNTPYIVYRDDSHGGKIVVKKLIIPVPSTLTDAIPRNSITEAYQNEDIVSLVNQSAYIKETVNGDICYRDVNHNYYTPTGTIIATGNNLPPSKTCSTVTYAEKIIDEDTVSILSIDTYTQVTDWENAPNAVQVLISNPAETSDKVFIHVIQKISESVTLDFWTDNATGDGQENATYIFTKGDRGNLPTVTHNLTALTKELGDREVQPRYTDNGIDSSIDATFKQWFYSTTGTITSNLLDGAYIEINSNQTNLNLASLSTAQYGSVLPYTIVVINNGVTVSGSTGSTGAYGKQGNFDPCSMPMSTVYGKNGGSGSSAIDFNGFSGKTVVINNNGVLKGGSGGRGGTGHTNSGGWGTSYTTNGGAGGGGASWKLNYGSVQIILLGNSPSDGSTGSTGSTGVFKFNYAMCA